MRLLLGGLEQSPWVLIWARAHDGAVENVLNGRMRRWWPRTPHARCCSRVGASVAPRSCPAHRRRSPAALPGWLVRRILFWLLRAQPARPCIGPGQLRRVVRPGGRLVVLEFFHSARPRPFWDGIFTGRLLPLLGWAISGDRAAYCYCRNRSSASICGYFEAGADRRVTDAPVMTFSRLDRLAGGGEGPAGRGWGRFRRAYSDPEAPPTATSSFIAPPPARRSRPGKGHDCEHR